MSEEIEYGTPAEMLLSLGDPQCPWTLEQRYVAAGHVLTDWQDNPAMAGVYEKVRHTYGVEDDRTVYDLGADDVFEIAEKIWLAVEAGILEDPRHRNAGVEISAQRAAHFNAIADGMPARLLDAGFVATSPTGSPAALPDLWVLASGTCDNAADYLTDIHPEDAQTLRNASAVFLRLFDFTLDLVEGASEDDDG